MNKANSIIMNCVIGCKGKNDLCIPLIIEAVEAGKTVFMLYTVHVIDKLKEKQYRIETKSINGVKGGMYISKI